MNRRCALVAAMAIAACGATAAQQRELQTMLAERRAQLGEASARWDRLVDLRIRHALGATAAHPVWEVDADERHVAAYGGDERLNRLGNEVAELRAEYERLVAVRDRLAATAPPPPVSSVDAGRRPPEELDLQELVARAQRRLATSQEAGADASPADPQPADDPGPTASRRLPDPPDLGGGGPALQLAAPDDPAELGRLLCEAAARRLLHAERVRADDPDAAAIYEEDARHSLLQAREILEAALRDDEGGEPSFRHLFALARACEMLGDHATANRSYERIIVRDAGGEKREEAGPWGTAARLARNMMHWERRARVWTPVVDVDALDWTRTAEGR